MAFIYNPLFRVYLSRDAWEPVNVLTGRCCFAQSAHFVEEHCGNPLDFDPCGQDANRRAP